MSLKSSVIISLIRKFLERIGTQGGQFVVVIVLTWLLALADFRQIALGTVFRNIFYKVAVKKLKGANSCLENHNRLSHVQASLVATFSSYGLQESAIFYKEAA